MQGNKLIVPAMIPFGMNKHEHERRTLQLIRRNKRNTFWKAYALKHPKVTDAT